MLFQNIPSLYNIVIASTQYFCRHFFHLMLDNSVASHELTVWSMWRCHGISLHLPYRAQTSRLRGELSDALSQQQETHASAQALQEMLDAVSTHGSLLEETQAKLRAQVPPFLCFSPCAFVFTF